MWLVASLNVPNYFKTLSHHHLKVIASEAIEYDQKEALDKAASSEALVVTSQETVKFISPVFKKLPSGKTIFCTGPSTLKAVSALYKGELLLPKRFDQEGLCELILEHGIKTLFYPKAKKIREYLLNTLENAGVKLRCLDCYQTRSIPFDLNPEFNITGHYFGSQSCVESYFLNGGILYSKKILVSGHVTKSTVELLYGRELEITVIDFK